MQLADALRGGCRTAAGTYESLTGEARPESELAEGLRLVGLVQCGECSFWEHAHDLDASGHCPDCSLDPDAFEDDELDDEADDLPAFARAWDPDDDAEYPLADLGDAD